MTTRVLLLTAATTAAVRAVRFDSGAPLDEPGRAAALAAAGRLPRAARVLTAPSRRCRETAAALGLGAEHRVEAALADWDLGRWEGRALAEVTGTEPAAVGAWLTDPAAAPHGGESLLALRDRVGDWLAALGGRTPERVLAIAEPAVVRAAVVHALALPPEAFWRLDVPPLTVTELSGRENRWNLRLGTPSAPDPAPDPPSE
ncbi:histidine phosphatase family protein [Streptomyces qinzhouensis]|uniref:Histidine phosphatase family protein n=1 Tax=Streptomyces qinzhouensis TaxID=2599401 RepID=A0A5B8IM11_9ACTN|nr:histidine phosphatase family protein [Streptomyces qinzhouensis]QDY79628.1 histidine phosphatase family protein [Streptomyces qinzhouensis]